MPQSWTALTWQQLCAVWTAKVRYGGNADAARAAALLALLGVTECRSLGGEKASGESTYTVADGDGGEYAVTARELSYYAKQAMQWFDYPYGDPGKPAEKDKKGKVIREAVEPHVGYVNPITEWRDAMQLPEETITIGEHVFALPQVAMNNLTWHQYRALQGLVPQLFQDGITEQQSAELHAQFLAYATVPDDPAATADPFSPQHRFRYTAERAEGTVAFWRDYLHRPDALPLFPICFQVYQTAINNFYSKVFHDLFSGKSNNDPLHTALTGEVGTLNAVMKYANYTDQQQVYDSYLPYVFDILNTMTKEARKIEEMNAKARRKK